MGQLSRRRSGRSSGSCPRNWPSGRRLQTPGDGLHIAATNPPDLAMPVLDELLRSRQADEDRQAGGAEVVVELEALTGKPFEARRPSLDERQKRRRPAS
jgi:hypothetical protein